MKKEAKSLINNEKGLIVFLMLVCTFVLPALLATYFLLNPDKLIEIQNKKLEAQRPQLVMQAKAIIDKMGDITREGYNSEKWENDEELPILLNELGVLTSEKLDDIPTNLLFKFVGKHKKTPDKKK